MTYDEVLERARGNMGPHCKACPICNGAGCKNTIPGGMAYVSGTVSFSAGMLLTTAQTNSAASRSRHGFL